MLQRGEGLTGERGGRAASVVRQVTRGQGSSDRLEPYSCTWGVGREVQVLRAQGTGSEKAVLMPQSKAAIWGHTAISSDGHRG